MTLTSSLALPQTRVLHHDDVLYHAKLHAFSHNPMKRTDRARLPGNTHQHVRSSNELKCVTLLASPNASFHSPFHAWALLRLPSRSWGVAGFSDSAVVYCNTATPYSLAFMAISPRFSSSPEHRDLNSDRYSGRCPLFCTIITHPGSNLFAHHLWRPSHHAYGGNTQLRPLHDQWFRDIRI